MLAKFSQRRLSGFVIGFIALSGGLLSVAPGHAQSMDYIEGSKLYSAQRYREAIPRFLETLKTNPRDGATYYYLGACYQQVRDLNSAKQYYAKAIEHGKSQTPGVNALRALIAIDPEYARSVTPPWNQKLQEILRSSGSRQTAAARTTAPSTPRQSPSVTGYSRGSSTPSSSSVSSVDTSLPQEGKFNIVSSPGDPMTYVSGFINGRPIERMLFDTGAEIVLFGRNHLQQYGIAQPSGPSTSTVKGVGGNQDAWRMNVDLKVGNIERRNFTITVQQFMDAPPLLGQTFFKDYQCQIDKQGGQIRLVRSDIYSRSLASAMPYANNNNVPFTRQGNLLVVQVQINGRTIPMCLDTGASQTAFTKEQLRACAVDIPQETTAGHSSGIGGTTSTVIFPVRRVKMGPIDKADFPISVVDRASMPYPLLGQDFFGDWRFSIDTVNNALKFHSRGSN